MVPLMVEEGYRPRGWLGLVLGARLWHAFYDSAIATEELFMRQMDSLCRELGERCRRRDWDAYGDGDALLDTTARASSTGGGGGGGGCAVASSAATAMIVPNSAVATATAAAATVAAEEAVPPAAAAAASPSLRVGSGLSTPNSHNHQQLAPERSTFRSSPSDFVHS
eukprot:COSAG05_NODE_2363_length_3174_cov_2.055935_1_plen_166_part_10